MIDLGRSSPHLLALLKRKVRMNEEQRREQRISGIYGLLDADSGISKEQVRRAQTQESKP